MQAAWYHLVVVILASLLQRAWFHGQRAFVGGYRALRAPRPARGSLKPKRALGLLLGHWLESCLLSSAALLADGKLLLSSLSTSRWPAQVQLDRVGLGFLGLPPLGLLLLLDHEISLTWPLARYSRLKERTTTFLSTA